MREFWQNGAMERLTARELFDRVKERLAMAWVAGEQGEKRAIALADKHARRPSLAGYLNIIYPNKLQIVGTETRASAGRRSRRSSTSSRPR